MPINASAAEPLAQSAELRLELADVAPGALQLPNHRIGDVDGSQNVLFAAGPLARRHSRCLQLLQPGCRRIESTRGERELSLQLVFCSRDAGDRGCRRGGWRCRTRRRCLVRQLLLLMAPLGTA